MAELNIRPIDAGLLRALKVASALCGETLREHVIAVLQKSLETGGELQGNSGGVAENASGKGETVPGTERPRERIVPETGSVLISLTPPDEPPPPKELTVDREYSQEISTEGSDGEPALEGYSRAVEHGELRPSDLDEPPPPPHTPRSRKARQSTETCSSQNDIGGTASCQSEPSQSDTSGPQLVKTPADSRSQVQGNRLTLNVSALGNSGVTWFSSKYRNANGNMIPRSHLTPEEIADERQRSANTLKRMFGEKKGKQ